MAQRSVFRTGAGRIAALGLGVLLITGQTATAFASPPAPQDEGAVTTVQPVQEGGEPADGGKPEAQAPQFTAPAPPTNEALPEEVDRTLDWQWNISCDPVLRPGIEAFANLLTRHYGMPAHSTFRSCLPRQSEHYDGRGLDWSMNAYDPRERAIGDAVATWLTENDGEMARRFGIQGIIWNKQSWHTYAVEQGWGPYTGESPHTDHLHFSFTWDGALMRTSWWTGVALTVPDHGPCRGFDGQYAALHEGPRAQPCPTVLPPAPASGHADVVPGGQGESVTMAQQVLGVPTTGILDDDTLTALKAWQKENGIPVTGVLDQATFTVMAGGTVPAAAEGTEPVKLPEYLTTGFTPHKEVTLTEGDRGVSVKALQRGLGVKADGVFGPLTLEALETFTASEELLKEASSTSPLVWHLLEQRANPTMPYRTITLAGEGPAAVASPEVMVQSRGRAVEVLQQQLGIEADGIFGPITEAAVIETQQEAGLPQTGIVDGPTWAAVDAAWRQAAREAQAEDQADTAPADGAGSGGSSGDEPTADGKRTGSKKADRAAAERTAPDQEATGPLLGGMVTPDRK